MTRYWNGHQWKDDHGFIPQAGIEPFCLNCGATIQQECTCEVVQEVEKLSGVMLQRAEEGLYDPLQDMLDGAAAMIEQPTPNMVSFTYADEDIKGEDDE